MDPLQVLERYFNAFVVHDDPKDFFIGMTDYLNYGDVLPEFDLITTQISAMPQELTARYEAQQKIALEKVATAHKKITEYVAKKKVENPGVKNALKEYDDFVEKRAFSSSPLPYTLHDELHDALEILHQSPEHRDFTLQLVELSPTNKDLVRRYLPMQELDDFLETKKELERGYEDALWGAQMRLYELRDIVAKGRETHRQIVERHKKREAGATFDLLNFGVIIGEWVKIEEGRPERDPVFFNPKKIRPKALRFHTYVLAHFAEARATLGQVAPKIPALAFDTEMGRLQVKGQEVNIRRISDQYDLLRVVFSDMNEVGKEWFFDDIAEKVDAAQSGKNLEKKYHNAAYQINRKLASKGVQGFFILNAHSAKIASQYLS